MLNDDIDNLVREFTFLHSSMVQLDAKAGELIVPIIEFYKSMPFEQQLTLVSHIIDDKPIDNSMIILTNVYSYTEFQALYIINVLKDNKDKL